MVETIQFQGTAPGGPICLLMGMLPIVMCGYPLWISLFLTSGCIFCTLVLWALHWCLFLQCVGSHVYVNICNYACQQLLSFFSDDAHLRDDVGFCFMFLDDVYRASEDEVGRQCVVALARTRIFSLKQSRHICM